MSHYIDGTIGYYTVVACAGRGRGGRCLCLCGLRLFGLFHSALALMNATYGTQQSVSATTTTATACGGLRWSANRKKAMLLPSPMTVRLEVNGEGGGGGKKAAEGVVCDDEPAPIDDEK